MPERTYRDVDVDLDDLADAIVDWFERGEFEVQDFQEGPSIAIQARKQNRLTMVSGTGKALNVRLSPLSRGLEIEITAGDWLDKAAGAGVALAARFIWLPLAVGTGIATGYGIYQQLKLPEQLLEFVERYLDRHGVAIDGEEHGEPRRRDRDEPVERDVEPADEPADPAEGALFCPTCGAGVDGTSNFCHRCGADLRRIRRPEADDEAGE